jgi:putative endonuclease
MYAEKAGAFSVAMTGLIIVSPAPSLRGVKRRGNLKTFTKKGSVMGKKGYVYMLTNKNNKVIYTGVTSNLEQRLYQHKSKIVRGFTQKYNCSKLVWYEVSEEVGSAIMREKQIKSGSRKNKEALIKEMNPGWKDLSIELFER